jgi:uncharacterized Fe-S cluster-containing MiaB family protein
MVEGFILDQTYGANLVSRWVAGVPEKSFFKVTKTAGKEQRTIETYRCPMCGYLESYAREIVG